MTVERPVVVASGPWEDPGWERPLLEAGFEVRLGPSADLYPDHRFVDDALLDLLADADAWLVSGREDANRRIMEACPRIDVEAATDLGILVVNSPAPENFIGVAEATVMLMLALTKRLATKKRVLRSGSWRDHTGLGTLLSGQTVGIIGLGRIGGHVARRLRAFDVRLLATDPYLEPVRAEALGAQLVPLPALLAGSDVVTLHVPLTGETHHLIDARALAMMRAGAYLINTSRGAVVEEGALVEAIQGGTIAGAALDVFEDEPLRANSALRQLDPAHVILTPHSIGADLAMRTTGTRMAIDAILDASMGHLPHHLLNPAAVPRWTERFRPHALCGAIDDEVV